MPEIASGGMLARSVDACRSCNGSPRSRPLKTSPASSSPATCAVARPNAPPRPDDALSLLLVMAEEHDPRFDRAAARWVGRLMAETSINLRDARFALAMVERLPDCEQALYKFAEAG